MAKQKEPTVKQLINALQKEGYFVAKTPLGHSGRVFRADRIKAGKPFKFAVVSCTHLGSRFQQITHLNSFYDVCVKRGVGIVYHCGDMVDGEKMWRGHEYEIFVHGADAQRDYAISNYPKRRGIVTKAISGNHDQSFWKTGGYNVVKAICKGRPDMEFLGDNLAFVQYGRIHIALMHGDGGVPYARSYRLQKIIEQLSPENKPHFLFVGHYHVQSMIPAYRNVEGVQLGCFQSQTGYLAMKGLAPNIGGLIVEVVPNDRGIDSIKYEWIPSYIAVATDF